MKYRRNLRERGRGIWGGFFNRSMVVKIIFATMIISVVEFIVRYSLCTGDECSIINYFALNPANILAGQYLWTLVLHIFVHGNVFHLFINMFVLFSLGGLCEQIVGRKRFLWFYLASGVFAGLLSAVLAGVWGYGMWESLLGNPEIYMVGASGAIFGIAGLFVMLLPRLRFSIIFLPFFSLPAYIMVPLVLILTWAASFFANLPIGNVAHLGGFLAGIACGYYLRVKYPRKVKLLQRYFK